MKTILVLEDDPINLELFQTFLELKGFTVLTAINGEEALRVYEDNQNSVDLLLADVILSGLDGMEVARRIVVSRPALKLLFMSGYPLEMVSDRLLDPAKPQLERVFFLQKPFMPATLLATIVEMVGTEA